MSVFLITCHFYDLSFMVAICMYHVNKLVFLKNKLFFDNAETYFHNHLNLVFDLLVYFWLLS